MLEQAEPWFLRLIVVVLGGYFLWSLRNVLSDFKDQVRSLRELIEKLFENDRDVERRLSYLEGKCKTNHRKGA